MKYIEEVRDNGEVVFTEEGYTTFARECEKQKTTPEEKLNQLMREHMEELR